MDIDEESHALTYQNQLHGSTEAGSGGFFLSRPPIVRKMNHRKTSVVKGSHGSSVGKILLRQARM